ncbi:recombinase family protein [Dermacoccus nishinomiyaensis]|uniref:recombinase family protein n=1 Tax=Dermacoccus nishinomiyaensis TaxID=1274 RepID=UPI001483B7AB|nr:recombinase family protein [Dermacoccus nishinomiyaensis]
MGTILELAQHGVSVETGDAGVLDPHTASGEAQINLMLAFERRRLVSARTRASRAEELGVRVGKDRPVESLR